MKLLTRISSMRRIAWNALSSCSVDSAAMWPDSEASSSLSGWMRSPCVSRTRVTGSWASQSISRSGWRTAQLVGDRHVALGVTEPDRGRDIQRPAPAAQRPGPGSWLLCRARFDEGIRERFDGEVDLDGIAAGRGVAAPVEHEVGSTGQLCEPRTQLERLDPVLRPAGNEHRQPGVPDASAELFDLRAAVRPICVVGKQQPVRVSFRGPTRADPR